MKISSTLKKTTIKSDVLSFDLLESGDVFRIYHNDNQINLLRADLLDGQVANIYLRMKDQSPYKVYPLIGIKAQTAFEIKGNQVVYEGSILDTKYQITLTVEKDRWYYEVWVDKSNQFKVYDLVYGQDIGIAHTGSIISSEAYTAQYIDHSIYENNLGYIIQSRQNQGLTQYLQIGALGKTTGFATDGFQIFDKSYKVDFIMKGLEKELPNENYQYEFPYLTLSSKDFDAKLTNSFTFYGYYDTSQVGILKEAIKVTHNYQPMAKYQPINKTLFNTFDYKMLKVDPLPKNYIKQNYKKMRHVEKNDKGLVLSFFTDNHVHVVTREKERMVERPHGHLLVSGDLLSGEDQTFATTNWMFGVFSSHVVLGNTNIQKLTGDVRNHLNLNKVSGLRILIKINDAYHMLGTPNIYEMGINYVKWIYQLSDDQLIVTAFVKLDEWVQRLKIESLNRKTYDFKLINQLVLGDSEYQRDIHVHKDNYSATIKVDDNPFVHSKYPDLKYQFISHTPVIFGTDDTLFKSEKGHGILSFNYENQSSVTLDTLATYSEFKSYTLDFLKDQQTYSDFIHSLTGFKLTHKKKKEDMEQLEDTLFWYTHNALVHYASPHGLEQSNGAAWGTRDVLQGPVELFFTANRFDLVRKIILKVYSRQFIETLDFPQWFMFDKYYAIQAHESHGDIIVWPIKVLADYLKATNDLSILDEKVPFMSIDTNTWVAHDSTIRQHVDKTLNAIQNSFVKGTSLPAYGGGDWDDTLQPANQKLTDHMVSGWTPVLLYEGLDVLSEVLDGTPLGRRAAHLKMRIKNDYEKYFLVDNVPAGFIVFEQDHLDYLLHPRDKNTGLKLRLLPLTRSIIAGMVTHEQALVHHGLIEDHLKHPDGVRLMDTFVTYKGGEKTYFQRGETAANLGREIGILYVHAHIRYIEAMAKLGFSNEAYEGLLKINPINIKKHVKNAQVRQANTYFSSSDAAFLDRYQAKLNFDKVKSGAVDVKAGWRLYSSGPGIYINQMIRNVFGIRVVEQNLVLDPVIPESLKGLTIRFSYFNRHIKVQYNHTSNEIKSVKINGKTKDDFIRTLDNNPYRASGIYIFKTAFDDIEGEISIVLS